MTNPPRIALITGSGRGIGAATARLLAQRGYDLCINYHQRHEPADMLATELRTLGRRVITVRADVSTEDGVQLLFREIDQQLGVIQALVNNAAILLPQCRVTEMDAERINRLFTVNVTSCFLCCREAIKRMGTAYGGSGGAIVNVSSAAARLGSPHEYIDYAATKGAIDTLTKGLALEVADQGIRVNAVRPGFIDTDMHADGGEPNRIDRIRPSIPLKRGGTPAEVAAAIAWLLSDEASYVTGSFTEVAGGR
ncbi:MAG: SDR family oxidoreductase [Thiolinea sp.]